MLSKLQKLRDEKSEQGFTIIEVMIVLAIAGLIILIVLLAVPALQRNGRNTAIKQDASAITAGINEFKSNNDGAAPTSITPAGSVVTITAGASAIPATAKVQAGTNVTTQAATVTTPPSPTASSNGTITVWFQHTCDATASTNPRAVSVYYPVETPGGTPALKCIDS